MNNSGGFTLIEVLIVASILSIVFLDVGSLTVTMIRGGSQGQSQTSAIRLGQNRLEQSKMIGYDNVDDLVGTDEYGSIENYGKYKRITSVEKMGTEAPMNKMKIVSVKVFWKNSDDSAENEKCIKQCIRLTTILSE